ncbi:MAG TPA: amidohydrolase family protein, partial [Gemmatimonadales bacterium]|nr:amidohydrolase family protein [Gemmatimonadales bacterium]
MPHAALFRIARSSLGFALAAALPLHAQGSRGHLTGGTFAVTNVAVVPMTSETVLEDAVVLVRDGRIAAVGRRGQVAVPSGARRIDGRGQYLIPGLADMHTHLYSDDPETPDSLGPHELGVMLANGVTVARVMIGTPEHLRLRREAETGRLLSPQLWVASPQFAGKPYDNGVVVTTPENARAAVAEAVAAGYDFIKLTVHISRPVYDAIVDEAARRTVRVVGHVDPQVGVARALEAGQQIEHLDGYFESVLADSAAGRVSVSNYGVFQPANWETLDYVDDAKLAHIAEATAKAGVWSTPTLTIFNTAFATGETDEAMRRRPDWRMIPPKVRELYLGARTKYWRTAATEARRRRYIEIRNGLTRRIAQAGGKILAGSDTPEWLMAYGWTLHRELEALVTAGLTPYQALEAATRNPAEFLGATKEWGTIEQGKRADLVLVSGNPLEDIRNTARIEGVAIGGRWLEPPDLQRLVATATDRLRGAPEHATGAAGGT